MNIIALFFLIVKIYHFINARKIAYFIQRFSKLMEEHSNMPERKQIIILNMNASSFIVYLIGDLLFLLYCMWLMFHDATWTPGFLLLIIAALEPLAVHARISGTYEQDSEGFVYPRAWFRYLSFAESMFILLHLFEGV